YAQTIPEQAVPCSVNYPQPPASDTQTACTRSVAQAPLRQTANAYLCRLRLIVIILYIVCFGTYLLFTRQPDYFDSNRTVGFIVKDHDKVAAKFEYDGKTYLARVRYPALTATGKKVRVVYEAADPQNASQLTLFGYWITIGELLASLVIVAALFYIAHSITSNPVPEALLEELEAGQRPRLRKYDP
ncbi:MAG TPA: hypothetical protein VF145_01310, partial [Chitinophagaceae bacterium]